MKISSPPSVVTSLSWHEGGVALSGGVGLIPKRVGREGGALISLFSFWRGGVDAPPPKKGEGRVLPV